jgi:hypothetical protein
MPLEIRESERSVKYFEIHALFSNFLTHPSVSTLRAVVIDTVWISLHFCRMERLDRMKMRCIY